MNTYKVYMHRHKDNGKVYIGCTKKSLSARFDNGNGYKRCARFWDAICKDGFDAFSHYKSIVDKKTWLDLPMRYQPYKSSFYEKLLHIFLK